MPPDPEVFAAISELREGPRRFPCDEMDKQDWDSQGIFKNLGLPTHDVEKWVYAKLQH